MPGSRYDRCIRQYDEIFAAEAANVPSVAAIERSSASIRLKMSVWPRSAHVLTCRPLSAIVIRSSIRPIVNEAMLPESLRSFVFLSASR